MGSLLYFTSADWKRLLSSYFSITVSIRFLECADNQLTNEFEEKTALKVNNRIRVIWSLNTGFNYEKGVVSKFELPIYFRYGEMKVWACWKSRSGRIIEIDDEDFICSDLLFWFESLDVEECRHRMNPKISLFTFPDTVIEEFKRKLNLNISREFITCADGQLTEEFIRLTGLKLNRHIGLTAPDYHIYFQHRGSSEMIFWLYVDQWISLTKIGWKSRSGKLYNINDSDINCQDLIFWFEEIDIPFIYKHLKGGSVLPFQLKDLQYKLIVNRVNTDCILELSMKNNLDPLTVKSVLDDFISDFNSKSELDNRKLGVIHNWEIYLKESVLLVNIDLGSTGHKFLKDFLKFLSTLAAFDKVIIGQ